MMLANASRQCQGLFSRLDQYQAHHSQDRPATHIVFFHLVQQVRQEVVHQRWYFDPLDHLEERSSLILMDLKLHHNLCYFLELLLPDHLGPKLVRPESLSNENQSL